MGEKHTGWQPIEALDHDDYVLGFFPREDGCTERGYFIGRRYDMRRNALINEWTGRWRVVTHWMSLPTTPTDTKPAGEGEDA